MCAARHKITFVTWQLRNGRHLQKVDPVRLAAVGLPMPMLRRFSRHPPLGADAREFIEGHIVPFKGAPLPVTGLVASVEPPVLALLCLSLDAAGMQALVRLLCGHDRAIACMSRSKQQRFLSACAGRRWW